MLTLYAKRTAYSIVMLAVLAVVGFAAIGSAKGVFAQETASGADEACAGIEHAQGLLREATGLTDLSTSTAEHLVALVGHLDEVVELQADGSLREAVLLGSRVLARIQTMAEVAADEGNGALAGLLVSAAGALDECLEHPNPEPSPRPEPRPHPAGHLVYSSKFLCGREVEREQMQTRQLGKQTFTHTAEEYQTEINVHNYSGSPVTIWVAASKANPMGERPDRTSDAVAKTLGPYEAMQVNCKNIARMLQTDVDHEVCVGKEKAQVVLRNALTLLSTADFDATSTDADLPGGEIRRLIKALDKAIALEEAGRLRAAFKLERQIAEKLGGLAKRAEENGKAELAKHLSEAQSLVLRCVEVLFHDIDPAADAKPDRLGRANKLTDGFVTVSTPREIEVTGVYRSTINSTGFGGGIGSGIDTEVVQIRPHRVPRNVDTEVPTL